MRHLFIFAIGAALAGCSATMDNPGPELRFAPGVSTGYFMEGGLIRGSYTPEETSRNDVQSQIRARCPRFSNYRELASYTPGVIGYTARCR